MSVPLKTFFKKSLPRLDIQILFYGNRELPENWKLCNVCDPFWRLFWNATPGAFLYVQGQRIPMMPDTLILLPPLTTFSCRLERPDVRHFWIHFAVGFEFPKCISRPQMLEAAPFLHLLNRVPVNDWNRALLLNALICEALLGLPPESFSAETEKSPDDRIYQSLKMLQSQAKLNHLNIDDICARLGISSSNFHRIFKEETGKTPKGYFMECRLEHAYAMLTATDLSIDEVAFQTGFSDRYHFSKVFKRHYSFTPAALKRNRTARHPL